MTKQINQDIAAFKDDFFKGLSLRETIYGGIALIVGVAVPILLYLLYDVNVNISMTLCTPFIGIIGCMGFYEKNGMTLPTIIKKWIQLHRQKPLVYCSRPMKIGNEQCLDKTGWLERILIKNEERRQRNGKE